MTTSDTPRTDAVLLSVCGGMYPDGADGVTESEDANAKLEALCRHLERENNALQSQLAEKDAALAVCVDALTFYANGQEMYQDERFSDFAASIIENIPEPAKQAAKVIEAAKRVADGPFRQDYEELCKAVRGMKG